MKLLDGLRDFPNCMVFRVDDDDPESSSEWAVSPRAEKGLLRPCLPNENFFVVAGKRVLQDGTVEDCFIDLALPERIFESVFSLEDGCLKRRSRWEIEGEFVAAIAVDCFGDYELFYSRVRPEVGIQVLEKGIQEGSKGPYVFEDLAFILRDEHRDRDAISLFLAAVEKGPSTHYIFGELADAYRRLGDLEQSMLYEALFARGSQTVVEGK